VVAILLALAVAATPAPAPCGLHRLDACEDTNRLVWDAGFRRAVKRFLGPRRASYVDHRGLVAGQMIDVLGGPPDPPDMIGERFRFTACRAHSCDEKGAAVLEPDGRLVALAILHSSCGEPHPSNDCYAHVTLTLFVRNPKREREVIDNLSDWARSEVADAYTAQGLTPEQLDGVEIEAVK
jgi:hypothetical protein